MGKTERTGLDYIQSSLLVTLNLQHCLDISLDRNLEFQRKSEDEATDLRVINQWMLWQAIRLKQDIYRGWINREEAISEHEAHYHLEVEDRDFLFKSLVFKSVYLSGCTGSQLWHMGSSLRHVGFLYLWGMGSRVGRLSSCGGGLHCFASCGILVSHRGIKPSSPAIAKHMLNYWTSREVPWLGYFPSKEKYCQIDFISVLKQTLKNNNLVF